MSLQCVTSPVYRTSAQQKLRSKQAAKQYRFGSPKLRDQLREKCRMRVREARQSGFNGRRLLATVDENFDFDEVLRQELASLENDIRLQEEIYKELRDELNDWFAEQLEAEESYLISAAESENQNDAICPVCQKHTLAMGQPVEQQLYRKYSCQCGASFLFPGDMAQLRATLRVKLDLHEQQCQQPLSFFLEPQLDAVDGDVNRLNAMCMHCDYFCCF